ncbi:MAG: BatA domain-containing protein [Flavobacteriales bacterium]|nr:BatA domain-containing protein [Flavobacteriales bacterium]MCB9363180.1 BatA domain-containing protein [Flavobacteriales bacterium]
MKFASPEFLYALIAIAIPIIIHLFNFRKFKKVYFSNISFLKEVKQETQSKSKLKHLLILLSRILAIIFLVFAFAQPFIPSSSTETNNSNVVGIYIDNSFSMESTGENGSLLNEAKLKAVEIVNSYKKTDHFVITDNRFSAGSQRLLNAEDAIDKLEEIQITPETKLMSTGVVRLKDAIAEQENTNKAIYVISDFQKSTSDIKNIAKDSIAQLYFVPVKGNQLSNIYIDSCWFNSPSHILFQQEKLSVLIKNHSTNDLENIPIKLYINNQLVSPASFSVKANEETILEINYQNKTNGIQNGKIELQDNPVTTDDSFFFSYEISSTINILEITNENSSNKVKSVYETDSVFNFNSYNVAQLDYSLIKKSDLVILNHLNEISSGLATSINNFVINGGDIVIIPSNTINYDSYREFLSLLNINYFTSIDTTSTKVKTIAYQNAIYQNVFEGKPDNNINLPSVYQHYVLSTNSTVFKNNVLSLKNGNDLLNEYKVDKGTVYLSTISNHDEFSNFTNHALFVPTFYNIGLLSQPSYPLFYTIGDGASLTLDKIDNESVYHLKNENFDIIPKSQSTNYHTTIFVGQNIINSGNYTLSSKTKELGLSFNYSRKESDLTCNTAEEIEEQINTSLLNASLLNSEIDSLNSTIGEIKSGKKYWKLCIILALLFLGAEIVLIKLFK